MHYVMGGVMVDAETQMSTVPGLFAAGECSAGLHGATAWAAIRYPTFWFLDSAQGNSRRNTLKEERAGQGQYRRSRRCGP